MEAGMAYGDGCVREVRDGTWRVRVGFGKDPRTGRRSICSRNVRGTREDAEELRDELLARRDLGLAPDAGRESFAEFSRHWLLAREHISSIGRKRLERERCMAECLNAHLGHIALCDIGPRDIEEAYSRMIWEKTKALGGVSGTTMRMHHNLLKRILAKAVACGAIAANPCDHVQAPRPETPEMRFLDAGEASRLMRAIEQAEAGALEELGSKSRRKGHVPMRIQGLSRAGKAMGARIALATGMRRGEVLGLTWNDVDFDKATASVNRSITSHDEVKPPKTRNGRRTLSIDADTCAHLLSWKARQAAELEKMGLSQRGSTPVCCSDAGGFVNPDNFSRWWREFAQNAGFGGLGLNALRHTHATLLIANGVDVKTVQRRLGHASASFTLDMYAHALPSNDALAARLMANLVRPDCSPMAPSAVSDEAPR